MRSIEDSVLLYYESEASVKAYYDIEISVIGWMDAWLFFVFPEKGFYE
jgi:hypothetical protein